MLPAFLFHFSFPSESELAQGEQGSGLSLPVEPSNKHLHILLGSWFSHFTEKACLEFRDCKLAVGIWPAGEWFGKTFKREP